MEAQLGPNTQLSPREQVRADRDATRTEARARDKAARDAAEEVYQASAQTPAGFRTLSEASAPHQTNLARDAASTRAARGPDDIFNPASDPDLTAAHDLANGKDFAANIDRDAFMAAGPEQQQVMTKRAEQASKNEAFRMADRLYNSSEITPERKAVLDAMQGDFSNPENAMKLGEMGVADQRRKALNIDDTMEKLRAETARLEAARGVKSSKMGTAIDALIIKGVMPYLEKYGRIDTPERTNNDTGTPRDPSLAEVGTGALSQRDITQVGEGVRMMFGLMLRDDKLNPEIVENMRDIFDVGTLRKLMENVRQVVTISDSKELANFSRSMGQLQQQEMSYTAKDKAIRDSIGDPAVLQRYDRMYPGYMGKLIKGIDAHLDGSAYANLGKADADMKRVDFEMQMEHQFGKKTEGLIKAFAQDGLRRTTKPSNMVEGAPETVHGDPMSDNDTQATGEGSEGDARLSSDDLDFSNTPVADGGEFLGTGFGEEGAKAAYDPKYLGGGPQRDQLVLNRKQQGSTAAEHIARARRDNPDREVSFVPFDQLPDNIKAKHLEKIQRYVDDAVGPTPGGGGVTKEAALKAAHDKFGDPKKLGMVELGAERQQGQLDEAQVKRLFIDPSKTSHMASKSRIDTGRRGQQLDATRMIHAFSPEHMTPFVDGVAHTGRQRLAQVFMNATAYMQNHMGEITKGNDFKIRDPNVARELRGQLEEGTIEKKDRGRLAEFDQWVEDGGVPEVGKTDVVSNGAMLKDKRGVEYQSDTFNVPDETVLSYSGGVEVTWGEVKNLSQRPGDKPWMEGKSDKEINTQLRREDALIEMGDAEVKQAHEALELRVDNIAQAQIEAVMEQGTRLTKEIVREIYADIRKSEIGQALQLAGKEWDRRRDMGRAAGIVNNEGTKRGGLPNGKDEVRFYESRVEVLEHQIFGGERTIQGRTKFVKGLTEPDGSAIGALREGQSADKLADLRVKLRDAQIGLEQARDVEANGAMEQVRRRGPDGTPRPLPDPVQPDDALSVRTAEKTDADGRLIRRSVAEEEVEAARAKDAPGVKRTFFEDSSNTKTLGLDRSVSEAAMDDSGAGRTQLDPNGPIHAVVAALGEDGAARKVGFDGEQLTYDKGPTYNDESAFNKKGVRYPGNEELNMKASATLRKMEQSTVTFTRETAAKGRALLGIIGEMAGKDAERMLALVGANTDDALGVINAMAKRYSDQLAAAKVDEKTVNPLIPADPTTPRSQINAAYEARVAAEMKGKRGAKVPGAEPVAASVEAMETNQKGFIADSQAGGERTKVVLDIIKDSDDAVYLRSSLDKLLALKQGNEHSASVVSALIAKIGPILHDDPAQAYAVQKGITLESRQKVDPSVKSTSSVRAEVEHRIKNILGPDVLTSFEGMLNAGEYKRVQLVGKRRGMPEGKVVDMIRMSIHALDPMGVGMHESLHGLVQHMREADLHQVNDAMYKVADSRVMIGQLEKLLANEPEALKQIRDPLNGREERAAYMYQFWDAGKLEVGAGAKTVFQKIGNFIKKVFGIWTADERAVNIMEYFQSGEYARTGLNDAGAVKRALLDAGTNKRVEQMKTLLAPVSRIATGLFSGGSAVIKDYANPALDQISRLIHSTTMGKGEDTGFISASHTERTSRMNELVASFSASKATMGQLNEALQMLQSGVAAASPEARALATGPIRKMLDGMYTYMKESGIELADKGAGKDYFPVVWDTSYIAAHETKFRAMLQKYRNNGLMRGEIDDVISSLLAHDGNEFGIETTRPGMQFVKERKLDFISPADRVEFLEKNMLRTLNSYVTQGTRRAEWARRFGDDSAGLKALREEAVSKHGATPEQMRYVDDFVRGVGGTLGDGISPKLRRLFGNAIVYQNVRLLPLAVFSMAIDPLGIMVRGGTIKDSFNAYKRGFMEIKRGFSKKPGKDEWYDLAQLMGTIDDTALVHILGSSYSQGMVGNTGRRINDTFFRYNLVEQMNTSMRVAAMPAALGFMAKHADGTNSPHSARWLAELNLKPGDIIVKDGRPLLTKQEFLDHGMTDAKATHAALAMRGAVNKWVDGAILRPNAAQKPGWMNDPHFALIAHLKQFMYSFNETIIKRVTGEAAQGNYSPAMALAAYVPIMMAADFAKGAMLTGGDQQDYKKDWSPAEHVFNGAQRAGLFSTAQIGLDVVNDFRMGGVGSSVLGPMIEQSVKGIGVMGGKGEFGNFAMNAMPAAPVTKAVTKLGESTAGAMRAR